MSRYMLIFALLTASSAQTALQVALPKNENDYPAYTRTLLMERLAHLGDEGVAFTQGDDALVDLRLDSTREPDLGPEGYHIRVRDGRATITAAGGNGLLYGSARFIEWVMAQTTPGIADRSQVDIDFPSQRGQARDFLAALSDTEIEERPFYALRGVELANLALGVADLIETDKVPEKYNDYSKVQGGFSETIQVWKNWCDWLARHRMNFISNWPYSAGTNWWELAVDSYTEGMSIFSEEEIVQGAEVREQLLAYARSRGLAPYLMNYVPGAPSPTVLERHPDIAGQPAGPNYPPSFLLSNPKTSRLFRAQIAAIFRTYPSLAGLHLRWWGESFLSPEDCVRQRDAFVLDMMQAVKSARPDASILMTGYFRSGGTAELAAQFPQGTIVQTKWGIDWEPLPQPNVSLERIRAIPHPLLISQNLPSEEYHSVGGVQYRTLNQGIKQYARARDDVPNLAGFATVSGEKDLVWITGLNYVAMARLNWDPLGTDVGALVHNDLSLRYGEGAADVILQALDWTQQAMEGYVVDFAGMGPYGDAARIHGMFGIQRIQGLARDQIERGRKEVAGYADLLSRAVANLERIEAVATPGVAFDDLMIQTRFYHQFMQSRVTLADAFLRKADGDIDGMIELLEQLKQQDAALHDLAMSKPNISDDFEMEGMKTMVNMAAGTVGEPAQIDALLQPDKIAEMRNSRTLFADVSQLAAHGEAGDRFPVRFDIPAAFGPITAATLYFSVHDLDGTEPGDEGVVHLLQHTVPLPPTGNGGSADHALQVDPADLKPGPLTIEFELAGRPDGTAGYDVNVPRLLLRAE